MLPWCKWAELPRGQGARERVLADPPGIERSDMPVDFEAMPFVPARNCGPKRTGQQLDLVVIHTMEAKEAPGTAMAVAKWFAGPDAPQASAHYCVDCFLVVQCVKDDVVAWAAPGANKRGLHIEHAGFAKQTDKEWDDAFSRETLTRSAELAFALATKYDIPIKKLSPDDLRNGHRGFCGHADVTWGLNAGKGHTDPGPRFPWDRYLDMVRKGMRDTLPEGLKEALENA